MADFKLQSTTLVLVSIHKLVKKARLPIVAELQSKN